MSPLNRREFLYSSVAVSAATALALHNPAILPEGARLPGSTVRKDLYMGPPRFERSEGFVNWREQGLNLGGQANRQYPG